MECESNYNRCIHTEDGREISKDSASQMLRRKPSQCFARLSFRADQHRAAADFNNTLYQQSMRTQMIFGDIQRYAGIVKDRQRL
jgi:hypothetical protein